MHHGRRPFGVLNSVLVQIFFEVLPKKNGQRNTHKKRHKNVFYSKTPSYKLEDLTVLKRSPDLLNNVKIGQDQLRLIMKHILFYGGCSHFGQVTKNKLMNTISNSPVISE